MNIVDKANMLMTSKVVREESKNFIEDLIAALLGDPISLAKVLCAIKNSPKFISQQIFFENFTAILEGSFYSEEESRKFSALLAEGGDKEDKAKRVVKIIDGLDSKKKANFIINLTRSLLADFISVTEYLRLCLAIKNTLEEDLIFLSENITEDMIEASVETISLAGSGLMYMSVVGEPCYYSFLSIAELLDKYGLSYGSEKYSYGARITDGQQSGLIAEINIPSMSDEEIDNICK